mmetsp:Transcript_15759/g.25531  ORF Transcript_15759/g.25531 Transcript_15759/m.25531 type:complete len:121 (-) Transcript_15759:440-802(-)
MVRRGSGRQEQHSLGALAGRRKCKAPPDGARSGYVLPDVGKGVTRLIVHFFRMEKNSFGLENASDRGAGPSQTTSTLSYVSGRKSLNNTCTKVYYSTCHHIYNNKIYCLYKIKKKAAVAS